MLSPYHGANYWTARPLAYFRFAEDSGPAFEEDGIFDTGFTARAFLPFDNSTQRIAARSYAGFSTVIDARVVCVRPRIKITGANMTASTTLDLQGNFSWDGEYKGLRSGDATQGTFSCIIVLGSSDDAGPLQRKVSLCRVEEDVAYLRGGVRPDMASYTTGYLVFNSTAVFEGWVKILDSKPRGSKNASVVSLDPANFRESGNSGTWQGLRFKESTVGIDTTLCFTNPIPWNYQIEAESNSDGQEPSLRWNISAGVYSNGVVRDFLGASQNRRTPEDRGLLRLQSRSNWSAADADDVLGVRTINYVWTAVQQTRQPVILNLASSIPKESELLIPHRGHVGLFQDIMTHTSGNAALAVQALFTTLIQMAYHDYLAEYDVDGTAAVRFSRGVVIPRQWNGFIGFCVILAAHLVLVFLITALFLACTTTSLIGNSWQAVGQVVASTDRETLLMSMERTDDEVDELLRSHGASEKQVRIRPKMGEDGL